MSALGDTLKRAAAAIQTLAGARLRVVGTPPKGTFWVYQKAATGTIYAKKDTGVEVSMEGGGGAATSLTETSGPTTLTMGAVSDGQTLKRVGSTVVGAWIALAYATSPLAEIDAPGAQMGGYVTGGGTVA